MENTQTKRHFTPEEYETVSERVEVKVEYLDGQIVPKEGLDPLPEWVVDELLKPNFNSTILNYEFPMPTTRHDQIINNIMYGLIKQLDEEQYEVYTNSPMIYISLAGRRRVPDIAVTPPKTAWKEEEGHLVNPHLVLEVLSPSNKGEDFMEKIEDYKSLESLKEYWLVSQDKQRLERFVRIDDKRWENLTYNHEDEEVEFPSLGVKLKTNKIYKGITFEKSKHFSKSV